MSPERRQRLDGLGFVWDSLEAAWDAGYGQLIIYVKRTGHCRVPQNHMENGFPLGQWVSNQRAKKRKFCQKLDNSGSSGIRGRQTGMKVMPI
jgi:hypothetical protein